MSEQTTPREPFTAQTETNFEAFISQPNHKSRSRVGSTERANYRHWLRNPTELPTGTAEEKQSQHVDKHRAISMFELRDGQLWRKAQGKEPAKLFKNDITGYQKKR
ncbi:MAG: hypothetical protein M1816_004471 [Peltula sp. TS41687]|nr:MAG: hypothetical protein M1816_004471 [Peltula sp. TS41687]